MSADNGIYIAEFPTDEGGVQWRVTHCQNIEDCNEPALVGEAFVVSKFGDSVVHTDYIDAMGEAQTLYEKICRECEEDGMPPVIEYGIQYREFEFPFPTMTREQANRVLDQYFGVSVVSHNGFMLHERADVVYDREAKVIAFQFEVEPDDIIVVSDPQLMMRGTIQEFRDQGFKVSGPTQCESACTSCSSPRSLDSGCLV